MRISELARSTGVSLPTVKYYLREGLLPAGRATAATQAEYDEGHAARLRLIRALVDVGGLSLAAVRSVLDTLDSGPGALPRAVGTAHSALAPTGAATARDGDAPPGRARALTAELGWSVEPDAPALHRLEAALTALDDVGIPTSPERWGVYADAALAVARSDIASIPEDDAADAVAFVVLGTVLYEPVLLALRRLAQQHVYATSHGYLPPAEA